MEKFLELLRESVILQGIITLMVVATLCYLFITGRPIPSFLTEIASLILGFYFGSKVQALIHKAKG